MSLGKANLIALFTGLLFIYVRFLDPDVRGWWRRMGPPASLQAGRHSQPVVASSRWTSAEIRIVLWFLALMAYAMISMAPTEPVREPTGEERTINSG